MSIEKYAMKSNATQRSTLFEHASRAETIIITDNTRKPVIGKIILFSFLHRAFTAVAVIANLHAAIGRISLGLAEDKIGITFVPLAAIITNIGTLKRFHRCLLNP